MKNKSIMNQESLIKVINQLNSRVGKTIKEKRIEKKLSQRKLAKLSNCSNSTISRLESGYCLPDIITLKKIEIVLDFSMCDVINENLLDIERSFKI